MHSQFRTELITQIPLMKIENRKLKKKWNWKKKIIAKKYPEIKSKEFQTTTKNRKRNWKTCEIMCSFLFAQHIIIRRVKQLILNWRKNWKTVLVRRLAANSSDDVENNDWKRPPRSVHVSCVLCNLVAFVLSLQQEVYFFFFFFELLIFRFVHIIFLPLRRNGYGWLA